MYLALWLQALWRQVLWLQALTMKLIMHTDCDTSVAIARSGQYWTLDNVKENSAVDHPQLAIGGFMVDLELLVPVVFKSVICMTC